MLKEALTLLRTLHNKFHDILIEHDRVTCFPSWHLQIFSSKKIWVFWEVCFEPSVFIVEKILDWGLGYKVQNTFLFYPPESGGALYPSR